VWFFSVAAGTMSIIPKGQNCSAALAGICDLRKSNDYFPHGAGVTALSVRSHELLGIVKALLEL